MSMMIKGCFQILLDMLLVSITHMDHILRNHMVILLNHIPTKATHLPDILLLVGIHQQVILPMGDTHLQVILPRGVTLQLVILVHQLRIIQGMDLVWGHCWLGAQLPRLLLMGLTTCHMDMGMDMGMALVMAMGSSSMENLSMGNLASAGRVACLENTRANYLRDGSDSCLFTSLPIN